MSNKEPQDSIVVCGKYQMVHVDYISDIDLSEVQDYPLPIKVVDDDKNMILRIELEEEPDSPPAPQMCCPGCSSFFPPPALIEECFLVSCPECDKLVRVELNIDDSYE